MIIYTEKDKKIHHPLFAGITYLAVDDFSIGNEDDISITESSNCSPSSLCFSTKKKHNFPFKKKQTNSIYDFLLRHNNLL
jgi:hypothetical protein